MNAKMKVVWLLLGVPFLFLVGCKAATTGGTGPDATYVAPEFPTLKLESLAYVGMGSIVPDPVAVRTADAMVCSYLCGGQSKFLIVDPETARSRAQSRGVIKELDQVTRQWRDNHEVDLPNVKTLGSTLGFDGFVFADLTQWREEQIDWTNEGNSFTEVGITVSIYDAETGLLAWKGEKMERRESIHYRPADSGGSGIYSDPGGIQRTERADRLTPPPPPAAEVAESVVQNLMLGLPDRPETP